MMTSLEIKKPLAIERLSIDCYCFIQLAYMPKLFCLCATENAIPYPEIIPFITLFQPYVSVNIAALLTDY